MPINEISYFISNKVGWIALEGCRKGFATAKSLRKAKKTSPVKSSRKGLEWGVHKIIQLMSN